MISLCGERNKDNSNCDTLHAVCVYVCMCMYIHMYMCMHKRAIRASAYALIKLMHLCVNAPFIDR